MTFFESFLDAYERAKTPTTSVEQCQRAAVEHVMRLTVHMCADLVQLQRKSDFSAPDDEGKSAPITRELTQAECVEYLRRLAPAGE